MKLNLVVFSLSHTLKDFFIIRHDCLIRCHGADLVPNFNMPGCMAVSLSSSAVSSPLITTNSASASFLLSFL